MTGSSSSAALGSRSPLTHLPVPWEQGSDPGLRVTVATAYINDFMSYNVKKMGCQQPSTCEVLTNIKVSSGPGPTTEVKVEQAAG